MKSDLFKTKEKTIMIEYLLNELLFQNDKESFHVSSAKYIANGLVAKVRYFSACTQRNSDVELYFRSKIKSFSLEFS